MKLAYTESAVADLVRLRAFIAEHDSEAARRIGEELLERLENLRSFPQLGQAVEMSPDPDAIRDMVFGNYVVRYAVHAQVVLVLRIWHHYEDR